LSDTTIAAPTRHYEFERCFNFRDIGGYEAAEGRTVRWGRLFRSMSPQWMTPADVERARALGIGLVIDLRGPDHPTSGPLGEVPGCRVCVGFKRAEFLAEPEAQAFLDSTAEEGLPRLLDRYAEHFPVAFQALAAADGAGLYHCQLGKDRTGVLSALILKTLEVSDQDVVDDYMYTLEREPKVRDLIDSVGEAPVFPGISARFVKEPVQAVAMVAVLHRLKTEFGGAEGYLVAKGVPSEAIAAMRERMLV
jgi:protein-tyrosine phosphatase